MRRIAYVARVKHDKESELRYHLDKSVPTPALKQIGIQSLDAYVGSGYCVFVFEYDGDFQEIIDRFLDSKEINEFRQKLIHVLEDFPAPGVEPSTAQMPLAGEAYHWALEPRQAM